MPLSMLECQAVVRFRMEQAQRHIEMRQPTSAIAELERVLKLLAAGLEAPDFPCD